MMTAHYEIQDSWTERCDTREHYLACFSHRQHDWQPLNDKGSSHSAHHQSRVTPPSPPANMYYWTGNPEEFHMLRQLAARIGLRRLWKINQVLDAKENAAAEEIVEAIGAPGALSPQAGAVFRKVVATAFKEWLARGFGEVRLNNRQRLATLLDAFGFTSANIGRELGVSASTARSVISRAEEKVEEIKAKNTLAQSNE